MTNKLFLGAVQECNLPTTDWVYWPYYNDKTGDLKALQLLDYHTFLPEVILNKVDRASMANSVEVRVPFLDHELTEMMMSLDERQYYKDGKNKHILYEILKNSFPRSILHKPKKGFGSPVGRFQNFNKIQHALLNGILLQENIIDRNLLNEYIKHRAIKKLWAIYIFEMWYRTWGVT